MSASLSGEESGLDDVVVVREGGWDFRGFLDHELSFFLVRQVLFSPKAIPSIYIWPPFNCNTHQFFGGGYVLLGCARESVA